MANSYRLRRFVVQINLPDLEIQSVFIYRSHFVMS